MQAFATIVSRLVPLLLVASACLIVARIVRDRLARRSNKAARAVFTAIVTATAALAAFVLIQAGCLMMARLTNRQDAATLDKWYRAYTAMHGRITRDVAFDWAMALMVQRRWPEARTMLLRTGTPSPKGLRYNADAVLLIAETFFYSGDQMRAEQALTVATRTTYPFVRFYLLGRVAAARGDTTRALDLYGRSLAVNRQFFPPFYHRERLLMSRGEFDRAGAEMEAMRRIVSTGRNEQWLMLVQALSARRVPPNTEFYVVEI